MAAIGCLVIHEPSAVMTSSHLWEYILVKDFHRVNSLHAADSVVIARKEAASTSVGEC
jgi:hypothetical protein